MPTDQQLKLALARLLPEKIFTENNGYDFFRYCIGYKTKVINPLQRVKETEWLHICWLIEQEMKSNYSPVLSSPQDYDAFVWKLAEICSGHVQWNNGEYIGTEVDLFDAQSASWQQRAAAICEVKGIKL